MEKGAIVKYSVGIQRAADRAWSVETFTEEYENRVIVDTMNIVENKYTPRVAAGELLTFNLLSAEYSYVGYTAEELTAEYAAEDESTDEANAEEPASESDEAAAE